MTSHGRSGASPDVQGFLEVTARTVMRKQFVSEVVDRLETD